MQDSTPITKRGFDTSYTVALQNNIKDTIVNKVIEVFRNPIPSIHSATDYAGTTNLCFVMDQTFLCYTFSYLDDLQPELKDVIDLMKGEEAKINYR